MALTEVPGHPIHSVLQARCPWVSLDPAQLRVRVLMAPVLVAGCLPASPTAGAAGTGLTLAVQGCSFPFQTVLMSPSVVSDTTVGP